MSALAVNLEWTGAMTFAGLNANGVETLIDGESKGGVGPAEMLLQAVGACASTDVVLILTKMGQAVTKMTISLESERHSPEPRYLTSVIARFDVWGAGLNGDKVARALGLSYAKYCSVYHTLRQDLELEVGFRLHESGAEAFGSYQKVAIGASA